MNGCFAEATALATTLDSIIIILKTGVSNCRDEKIKESRNKKITRPAKDVVVTKHYLFVQSRITLRFTLWLAGAS